MNKRQIELKLDTINRQINIMIGELWKRDIEFEDINLLPYFKNLFYKRQFSLGMGSSWIVIKNIVSSVKK